MLESLEGQFSITTKFRHIGSGLEFSLVNVYGPPGHGLWPELLTELADVCGWVEGPLCLGGDFNLVRYPSEKFPAGNVVRSMGGFNEFIGEFGLIDIQNRHTEFTWSNFRCPVSMSKLDRFLVSANWLDLFPNCRVSGLPRIISDHVPIFMNMGRFLWGPAPFRFSNWWFQREDLRPLVGNVWRIAPSSANQAFWLADKLKFLKVHLQTWSRNVVGSLKQKKENLSHTIGEIDKIESSSDWNVDWVDVRAALKMELEKVLFCEEIDWKQKSRDKFLKEGDSNTAYFHSLASGRRKNKLIEKLLIGDREVSGNADLQVEIPNFFQGLFSASPWSGWLFPDGLQFGSISEEELVRLEGPFHECEIVQVLASMNMGSAPGPDGFNIKFFKECWSIIGPDVMGMFLKFHSSGFLDGRLNNGLISLIPKVSCPVSINEFRPISVINSAYRILAKTLASRLAKVLPKLISPEQGAFVNGRLLINGVAISSEALHSLFKSRLGGLVLKLDMSKAYDRVEWRFLDYILGRMGFGSKWRLWVHRCLSRTKLSVLVNGKPSGFFSISRGLRQGDPLAPLLFALASEAFSRMLSQAHQNGLICGITFGDVVLTHLLYADDVLIFLGPSCSEVKGMLVLIRIYELMSGQRVSLEKSAVFGINVDNDFLLWTAKFLNCSVGSLPSLYLGLPLRLGKPNKADWLAVISKMEQKLGSWKGRFLSLPGRLVLIKASLAAIPIYFLSCFKVPVWVANRIEQIQRNFLWHGMSGHRKLHLIKWGVVCSPVEYGGLGLRRVRDMNRALLAKWVWRFGNEEGAFWRRIIAKKYGLDVNGWMVGPRGAAGYSGFWKAIREIQPEVWSQISLKVGDGKRTRFWKDRWCGEKTFMEVYPRLFRAAVDGNAFVAEYFSIMEGTILWEPIFRRQLREFEIPDLIRLKESLALVQMSPDQPDSLRWPLHNSGHFTVKSFYREVCLQQQACHPMAAVWRMLGPPRPKSCLWLAGIGKILTRDALSRRGMQVELVCPLCGTDSESPTHLFLSCSRVAGIWDDMAVYLGVQIQTNVAVDQFIINWISMPLQGLAKYVWQLVILAVFWSIWSGRNRLVFQAEAVDPAVLADRCRRLVASWAKASKYFDSYSFSAIWRDDSCFLKKA